MIGNIHQAYIVHIIAKEKFTIGYINFMKMCMQDWKHYFFVCENEKYPLNIVGEDIFVVRSNREILRNTELKKILDESTKIIISGLFDRKFLLIAPTALLKKIYIQFWGGDFYFYRNSTSLKIKFKKKLLGSRIAKCAGVINLIEDDYTEFCKIFPDHKRHFTAPMPADPKIEYDYAFYRKQIKNKDFPIRILLGNSATKENQHVEVFEILRKYEDEQIEIVCPLSYGDEQYRDEVIAQGEKIWRDKFLPLTEFMDKDEYIKLLATCDVAIFNNNRQQAMGNIWILINLGKKIFMRDDTPMWTYFRNLGVNIFNINKIQNLTLEQFVEYDLKKINQNYAIADGRDGRHAIRQWSIVFGDY